VYVGPEQQFPLYAQHHVPPFAAASQGMTLTDELFPARSGCQLLIWAREVSTHSFRRLSSSRGMRGFPMLDPYKHLDNRMHVYYSNSNLSTCTSHLPRSNYHHCLTNMVCSYWLHHHRGRSKSIQVRNEIAGAKKRRRCQCFWSMKPSSRQKTKLRV
jgi:hypothetical protein